MSDIPIIKLNTGAKMSQLGFGTWKLSNGREARNAVVEAIKIGYRLIDTAHIYGNEKSVGQAIAESEVPREELFITTKLWNGDQGYDKALKAFDESLEKLGLEYLDLYLIHWPATDKRAESWKALQEIYKSGRAKAIGVSNYTVNHLEELLAESDVVPAVNQVEFHPFLYAQQKELLEFCHKKGIVFEAYSPLARTHGMDNTILHAVAERHAKTPAQVMLRWAIQHNTVPIPKSSNPERIRENFKIFNFELSDEEMKTIDRLSTGEHMTWDPTDLP
jgi:diketogulonate reductase-like aldo/keto reductase